MAYIAKVGEKYQAQIRVKGHPSASRTFDRKAQAVAWGRETEQAIRDGEFSDSRGLANHSISSLIDRYSREVGAVKEFGRSKKGALQMLVRHMGSVTLAALTDEKVIQYCKDRQATGAGGVTVQIELTYLGGVLGVARSVWKIPYKARPIEDARPSLRLLRLVGKSKERDRRPSDLELTRLCAHFDNKALQRIPMATLIRFAVATAMRAGEITGLRWEDLNEKDRTIVIRDRKHPDEKIGNDQTVPLLGEAFSIVMAQSRSGDLIFPYNTRSLSSIFPRACTALEIEDLQFHDLRHEGISRLFEKGYQIQEVALVSGHRDWKMLKRYTQIRAKNLHRD